jgi:hypothetical protein
MAPPAAYVSAPCISSIRRRSHAGGAAAAAVASAELQPMSPVLLVGGAPELQAPTTLQKWRRVLSQSHALIAPRLLTASGGARGERQTSGPKPFRVSCRIAGASALSRGCSDRGPELSFQGIRGSGPRLLLRSRSGSRGSLPRATC